MSDVNFVNKICGIIVLYNPDIDRLYKNVMALINQVEELVMIDNFSSNLQLVKSRLAGVDRISYIVNKQNEGIAKALNQGMKFAQDRNYKWALTMDQDSVVSDNLILAYSKYMNWDKLAIICPLVEYKNYYRKKDHTGNHYDYVEACMTSGSLTNVDAWKYVGGFDEWMFIDYVDNDFCTNLRLSGYKILRANNAILYHELGNAKKINIGLCHIVVFNYSKIRNYYYVRNTIYYIKKYFSRINIIKFILILVYVESKKIIFENNRKETVSSFLKGFIDGIKKSNAN